jgi:thymidine kinase
MEGTCESCGRDGEELVLVRRAYVTPETWDTPERVETAGEERWCAVCRSHYPHQFVEGVHDTEVDSAGS